jgi:GntR family transcriptional regulator/MocR family aminotransferase
MQAFSKSSTPKRGSMFVKIDRNVDAPLQAQIYTQLRDMIDARQMRPGMRVATTRTLARQLGISRMTVLLAYEQLIAEGYLQTRRGIGTFVSLDPPPDARRSPSAPTARGDGLSEPEPSAQSTFDFGLRRFAGDLVPFDRLRRHVSAAIDEVKRNGDTVPSAGHVELRRNLAQHIGAVYGIGVAPEDVVVFGSRLDAYKVVAHLSRAGEPVFLEASCAEDALKAYASVGLDVRSLAVDENGMRVDQLPSGAAAMAHVTPAHQRYLGVELSMDRRTQLLDWAERADAIVLEDDCDSGTLNDRLPLTPLFALRSRAAVIHVGGFERTLGQLTSLTYLIVPKPLVGSILELKCRFSGRSSLLEQCLLARFIASGEYARHLRRLRKVLHLRRDALIHALRNRFGSVKLLGIEAPTQLAWVLGSAMPSAAEVRGRARLHGIAIDAPERIDGDDGSALRSLDRVIALGYAGPSEARIAEGVARLAEALSVESEGGRPAAAGRSPVAAETPKACPL